jgi:hypothetical protein
MESSLLMAHLIIFLCCVEDVRVQWVDLTNKSRLRIVSLDYFEKVLQSSRPGLGVAKAALGLVELVMAEGFGLTGEYLCVPDLTSLRVCPYAPRHASVMVWLQEKTPAPGPDGKLTVDVDLCPRTLLSRVLKYVSRATFVRHGKNGVLGKPTPHSV